MSDSVRFSMFYTKKLLDKIDRVKQEKGFTYRSQTIIYLINLGLEQLKKTDKNK